MTRIAVITDVHADVHALRDAFTQIDHFGIETILCCGDLLDYGLFPEGTLALLRERNVVAIRGNHDRWAIEGGQDMSGWDLTAKAVAYLQSLPQGWRKVIDGVAVVLAHGRPGDDMNGVDSTAPGWELAKILDDAQADVLFLGHTHAPFIRRVNAKLIINPGALLRDPGPGYDVTTPGTFAVVEITETAIKAEIRRAVDGALVKQHGVGRCL